MSFVNSEMKVSWWISRGSLGIVGSSRRVRERLVDVKNMKFPTLEEAVKMFYRQEIRQQYVNEGTVTGSQVVRASVKRKRPTAKVP